jgi:hypothetical protein
MAAVAGWQGQAQADGSEAERLESLEQRVRYMEQRLQAQDQAIQERDSRIAELEGTAGADSWLSRVEVGGLVEIEARYNKTDGEDAATDLSVATVELGFAAQVNDWVGAEAVLLYEGEDLEVDTATISLADPEGPWSLTGGKQGVPFGSYETQLVSDPLTLDVGETAENALVATYEVDGLVAAAYLFNGTNNKDGGDAIDNFGATIGYSMEGDDFSLAAGIGYINDISDSDGIQDALASNDNVDYVSGWTASAMVSSGPVTVIGEYVAATDAVAGLGGEQPSAWNIEAGIGFEAFGRDATFAVAYQGSEEASSLDIAEKRWLAGVSIDLMENTGLGIELANETAYDGTDSQTLTGLLSVEF